MKKKTSFVRGCLGLVAVAATAGSAWAADSPWTDVPPDQAKGPAFSSVQRELKLDFEAMRALLARATPTGPGVAVELPVPEGGYRTFLVNVSRVMPDELAKRYPAIRTFLGTAEEAPQALLRSELTARGFHAMVVDGDRVIMVEPLGDGRYAAFLRGACPPGSCPYPAPKPDFSELEPKPQPPLKPGVAPERVIRRTYRIAVAASGEFTAAWGGTAAAGLSGVVQAINRVNGIFERDLALTLELVPGNAALVFTDAATDPYGSGPYTKDANSLNRLLLDPNQQLVDRVIGPANYDLGHLLTVNNRNSGAPSPACGPGKAAAYSASPRPTGDAFWVDYVAHVIGHQVGATHSFNGSTAECAGARNPAAAFEPGGGSTVMAYGGICGAESLQFWLDPYFHVNSVEEVQAFLDAHDESCGSAKEAENSRPWADAGPGYVIPAQTPFHLTGRATDPDGDALTHAWEELDLGPPSPPSMDDGARPLFRSYPPTLETRRYFPPLRILRAGTTSGPFETLPSTSRSLRFRFTARDGHLEPDGHVAGGVSWGATTLAVVNTGAPFAITQPTLGTSWPAGGSALVLWNVAGTDRAPIGCGNVDIRLSIDEGDTFPYVLARNTPNDGSQLVSLPNVPTQPYEAFLWVECSTAPFFAFSRAFELARPRNPPPQ